jgi:hypothetical protein
MVRVNVNSYLGLEHTMVLKVNHAIYSMRFFVWNRR